MKFLHQRGFTSTPLQPALFTGMTPPIQPQDQQISLFPKICCNIPWLNGAICLSRFCSVRTVFWLYNDYRTSEFCICASWISDTGRGLQALKTVKVIFHTCIIVSDWINYSVHHLIVCLCLLSAWPAAHFPSWVLFAHNLNCPEQPPGTIYKKVNTYLNTAFLLPE